MNPPEPPMIHRKEQQQQAIHAAEYGDLRPQFNPHALAAQHELPQAIAALEPILLDRFFQLSRPIADANSSSGERMRLEDAGRFFYLIETLNRLGYPKLDETLLMILDDFCQLDLRSYNELYLWCIVQLSRSDVQHVKTFWPLVITLDLRYRSTTWRRPAGTRVFEQPYRLTDLVFYYFVLYTLDRQTGTGTSRFPSLGACLLQIVPGLSSEQLDLVVQALGELEKEDHHRRPGYGDALGLLLRFKSPKDGTRDSDSETKPRFGGLNE